MNRNVWDSVTMVFFVVLMISSWAYFMMVEGSIIIERPYQNEYSQCETKLYQCIDSKTPACAPCECTESHGYWIFYILGALIYVFVIYTSSKRSQKLDEREKELNERHAIKSKSK